MKRIFSILLISLAAITVSCNLYAASKHKTVTHKVNVRSCEKTRKAITNRCRYKHKFSKRFCDKQDRKNAKVCSNLRKKVAAHKRKIAKKKQALKAADAQFDACVKKSDCDHKPNEAAIKVCYNHCHKRAGYHKIK